MSITFDFLPVSGEAILITTDGAVILLDSGQSHPFKGNNARQFKKSLYYKEKRKMPAIDILIITHIDYDHINGAIGLLCDNRFSKNIKQIWFNEPDSAHLFKYNSNKVSIGHGIKLKELIDQTETQHIYNISTFPEHNRLFQSKIENTIDNVGFTLLAPSKGSIDNLYKKWDETLYERNKETKKVASISPKESGVDCSKLNTQRVNLDDKIPNGSSIAFILHYKKLNFLLLGDAHITIVCDTLKSLGYSEKNPLCTSFVKLSHHGSFRNLNREFLQLVVTNKYVICRNSHASLPNINTILAICCYRKNKDEDITIYINKPFNQDIKSINKNELRKHKVAIELNHTLAF